MDYITKRDGSIVPFDFSKILKALKEAVGEQFDEAISNHLFCNILMNMKVMGCTHTKDVTEKLIDSCAMLIENTVDGIKYDYIARRLLTLGVLKGLYPNEPLDSVIFTENEKICKHMMYAGASLVVGTYLQRCKKTKRINQDFVSWRTLKFEDEILGDAKYLSDGTTVSDAMKKFLIIGSTPMSRADHAQTDIERQLSSCFITHVADDTNSIFQAAHEIAIQSGLGGGCGFEVTNIRERGHGVRGMPNSGGGVVQTCKIFESVIQLFNQGGARAGSAAAYLSVWHPDIMEFLCSQDTGGNADQRLYRLQIGVNIHDNFMEAVREDGDYYLFSPVSSGLYGLYGQSFELRYNQLVMEGKYHSKVKARDIFSKIVEARIHKYCFIMFIDNVCNSAGEWIAGSNICTEIIGSHTKDKTVVCTLGSVNLSRCFSDRDIAIGSEACIKLLHYSLLSSKAPTERGRKFNNEDQMVGCSFMGLAEYLSRMGLVAGTQEYLNEIERICIIRKEAIQKYIQSTNGRFNPIRTTTSPPNESIAIICGTTSSHELPVSTDFTKGLNGKSLPIILPDYKGKTAYEINIEQQMEIIQTLQKHTDQAISFNTYHSDMKFKAGIKYLLEQEISSDNSEALRREIDVMSMAMTSALINEVSISIVQSWTRKIKTLYYIRKEDVPVELAACQACAG